MGRGRKREFAPSRSGRSPACEHQRQQSARLLTYLRALLNGRTHVSTDDIAALAAPVLRHRIVTNFTAESEGITPDRVVSELIKATPSKEGELTRDPRLQKIFAA